MNEETLKELKEAIIASSAKTKIYVGCDSKRARSGKVKYATVVILHIDGKHGGKLYSFIDDEMDYSPAHKPKMRLITEAYKAVDVANEIMAEVGTREFELHLDLNSNPKYKSSAALKEAVGYVMGMLSIQPKFKPEAWAASTAADRLSRT